MAVRYTVIETEIYTAIQKFKQKHKKQSINMTQITSPQTWQINYKSGQLSLPSLLGR